MCFCHHKTIRSVGWVLLMQVNIASRAAILIMSNIIQYIRWLWTAGQANKAPSTFCARCFFFQAFSPDKSSNIDTRGKMLMLLSFFFSFHLRGGAGGWEEEGSKWNTEVKEKPKKKNISASSISLFFSCFVTNSFFMHVKRRHGERRRRRRMLRKQ